jgi:acyl carrier protein
MSAVAPPHGDAPQDTAALPGVRTPPDGPLPEPTAEVLRLLGEVLGEDEGWAGSADPLLRLDGDLFLESVELAELSEALRARFGEQVDLAGMVAGLDLDAIIALTVADVAAYVAQCSESPRAAPADGEPTPPGSGLDEADAGAR